MAGNTSNTGNTAGAGAGAGAGAVAGAGSVGTNSTSQSGSGHTSNSNGNFSGGNISNGPLGAPTAPGFASGDYSFGANLGWSAPVSMDGGKSYTSMNVGTGESFNSGSNGSGISVDDVFGNTDFNPFNTTESNKQGDYAASSKTESNIETDTFGKQDDISVTPKSVEENKGVVDNQVIDSVESLVTEQKDKEGRNVLDASKKRSEAEEEDAANNMRDNLRASNKEETVEENDFQVGEEAAAKEKAALDEANKNLDESKKTVDFYKNKVDKLTHEYRNKEKEGTETNKNYSDALDLISDYIGSEDFSDYEKAGITIKEGIGIKNPDGTTENAYYFEYNGTDENLQTFINDYNNKLGNHTKTWNEVHEYKQQMEKAKNDYDNALIDYNNKEKAYNEAKENYDNTFTEQTTSKAQKAHDEAMEALNNSKAPEETKAEATEALNNLASSRDALTTAIDNVNKEGGVENASPEAVQTLMNAYNEYNNALKAANNKYKGFKGTDFNKEYAKDVMNAKDFDVTLADGSKMSFADYATEMATKSPTIAAAMYEAKAQQYEKAGHKMLAAIERGKANIMKNNNFWSNLARPFLGADNKARAMFTNMANTNMRATYNTYNNVLNNPNATPEQKAEAKGQIAQANALMQAATALDASTGIGGWGDDMTDGEYGVTNPGELNGWQNFNAHVSAFAQALLGLGVTPAANKAYQKAFYLNPNAEGFLAKDFDGDGFALTQEYGNNAAAQITFGGVELATGVALCFNPATLQNGINMITDAIKGMYDSLFGIKNASKDTQNAINQVLNYFNGAAETNGLPEEVVEILNQGAANIGSIDNNVNVFENFQLKSDEVGNLDNWLEGSGSNTATNEKFNQSLSYDEWLKLIEADEVMKDYVKRLTENAKKNNANKGVNA